MSTTSDTSYAMTLAAPGGPDKFARVAHEAPPPGDDEIRVRHDAVGLNFIDTYHRSGIYPLASYPAVLGVEAAGTVVDAGTKSGFDVGQRVAYVSQTPGAYATTRTIHSRYVVPLPVEVEPRAAAAVMLKGLTARYLLKETTTVAHGSTILVYAAAGGVGSLLVQWARHLNATVIATVGTHEKAERAKALGSHHTIVYTEEDVARRVDELTDGVGVDVVYDSVGAPMFGVSLACLRPRGLLVAYGQSSGEIPSLTTSDLARAGSVYLTRPTLWDYIREPQALQHAASELFQLVAARLLRVDIGATWPLAEVGRAHAELEARRTTGSVVLIP